MWKKTDHFVEKHHMILEHDRILIGLSGGADSIYLARYLLHLRDTKDIFLCAAHVNHQLRGEEADRDEAFVADFCERWEIPLFIFHEDVKNVSQEMRCSLEEAGRAVRYDWLRKCAQREKCDKIALAHHAGDQAETMIFRMIRGTGPAGMAGILPVNHELIRPLLSLEKREILMGLKKTGQEYVEDSTNAETGYSRNYIRHCIIPKMCEMNPEVVTHLSNLAQQVSEQNNYLKRQMDAMYEQHVSMDIHGVKMRRIFLERCDIYEQKEMVRRMIFQAGGHQKDITAAHVAIVLDLLHNLTGKKVNLPYDLMGVLLEEYLYIGRNIFQEENVEIYHEIPLRILEQEKEWMLRLNDKMSLLFQLTAVRPAEFTKNDCVKYFDYDIIKDRLCVRTRRTGDYFIMDVSGCRKKLKRYFIDKKIPQTDREKMLLLAQDDHILWIIGDRISEVYKVTDQTRMLLRVSIVRTGGFLNE